ncbi:expressed unknown protein [Seminavis robusta]|uniref:Uncharacterized protein n=1 Tax=Seminavis robusta TaxID=568900 RepID=A0A9N8EDY2_9STRA|nr:expressed unknown protein [Seminavis robusta]|eukprot:Sro950_g223730.1 n/a (317) ;mRNA; r:4673-5623
MADTLGTDSSKKRRSYASVTSATAVGTKKKTRKAKPKPSAAEVARGATEWKVDEFYSWSVETQTSKLPFCLAEGISLHQFEKMIEHREKTGRSSQTGGCFKWEFRAGKAWIYELPHRCHEEAAGQLAQEIVLGLGAHGRDVKIPPSPRMADSNGALSAEPDSSVEVRGGGRPGPGSPDRSDAQGNRFSNIVFEVAYNESERHVRAKAQAWLLTAPTQPQYGVQQGIVVKIGTNVRVSGHRTMKAFRYERANLGNPVQEIEFGHDGPNGGATAAGIPAMQINVPTVSIYHPLAVPDGLGPSIPIDLFEIRQVIEDSF